MTKLLCLLLSFAALANAGEPFFPMDLSKPPSGIERIEFFLLIGQSNMKGRGIVPEKQTANPLIAMMHLRNDQWYLARHPLHLTGDPVTLQGSDNAGVGPGLAFAEAVAAKEPHVLIGLIPCAVGGSRLDRWVKDAKFYEDAVRRTRLALGVKTSVPVVLKGVLWLQGEADARPALQPTYETRLTHMIDDLRADLKTPELSFIAATIGEFRKVKDGDTDYKSLINATLLSLPKLRPHTACVDARVREANQAALKAAYDKAAAR
jgi:hypothetical protein